MAEPSPLSERELDIMRQVATGATNREIAHVLEISPNTVKVHLRNIFEKLEVASRTEATLIVVREGWIEVEGVAPADDEVADDDGDASLVRPEPRPAPRADLPLTRERATVPRWLLGLLGGAILLLATALGALLIRPDSAPEVTQAAVETRRWQSLAPLPAPRVAAGALALGRDLLVVGGEDAGGATGEIWRYDLSSSSWQPLAPLPLPVRDAAVARHAGGVLVAGGIDGSNTPRATLQRYDPAADAWTLDEEGLPAPLARAALAPFEGELYLFGGHDGERARDEVYRYVASDAGWEPVATLPAATEGMAAVTLQDGIVLIGGRSAGGQPRDQILHFDPRAAEPFRADAPLPTPAGAPRAAALGSAIYVLADGVLLERDPASQWQQIALPTGSLPTDGALVASDPFILTVGGVQDGEPIATVWQYQALFRTFIPAVPNR